MLQINGIHKYFAPDGAAGAPGAAAPQQELQAAAAPPAADALTMTQAEFDRRVQKALDTVRATWEKGVSARIDGAVSEAQRLAAMTADQRAAHDREQTEKALAQREAAVTRRRANATSAARTIRSKPKNAPGTACSKRDPADGKCCSATQTGCCAAISAIIRTDFPAMRCAWSGGRALCWRTDEDYPRPTAAARAALQKS